MGWFKSKEEKEEEILDKAEKIRKERQVIKEIRDEIQKGRLERFAENLDNLSTERLLIMKERARYELTIWFIEKDELKLYKKNSLEFNFSDYNVIKGSAMESISKYFDWRDERRAVAANFLIDSVNFILDKRGLDGYGRPKDKETSGS